MSKAYEVITDRIIALLEQGTVPWRKPWRGGEAGRPRNLSSGRPYRGINVCMLACQGYASPYWLTFKQAKAIGGYVKKGERGSPVVYWNWLEKADPNTDEKKRIPFLRYYTVFNILQCSGLAEALVPEIPQANEFHPIDEAELIIRGMPSPPTIRHGEQRAYYRPSDDLVNMPASKSFDPPEEYYSTLFHELIHATGHKSRLARKGITELEGFGSHRYSSEELVAEMGAVYLCGMAGIENATIDNSAAYIQGWLKKLRDGDKRLIVHAAAQSQRAADLILGMTQNNEEGDNDEILPTDPS